MMRGKDWSIVLPKRKLKTYTGKDLVLERAEDVVYPDYFRKRLDEVKAKVVEDSKNKKRQLFDSKLVRFSYSVEDDEQNPDVIGLNQMVYLDYISMTRMIAEKEEVPYGYAAGVGMIITVRASDNKFLYTIRTSKTSNWEGSHSVFGGALSANIGDTDQLVDGGTGKLISIMAERAAQELGIDEKEINSFQLFGVAQGEIFTDHIFCANAELSCESGKIVKAPEEMKKRGDPVSSKYREICSLDASHESVKTYLHYVKEILDVAAAGWALTTANYWGLEKARELKDVVKGN